MKQLFVFFVLLVSTFKLTGQSIKDSSLSGSKGIFIGPENGYLLLGGATWEDSSLLKKFVSLAGVKPNVLIIPTGGMGDSETINENEAFFIDIKKAFKSAGAGDVKFLHTRDAIKANSTEFLKKIKEANAIWFTGGNVRNIANSYLNTNVVQELQNLLNRNGVIGGNSAGANIMGTYFFKLDDSKPGVVFEKNNNGLNLIKNTCIFPHLLSWNRQFLFFDFKNDYHEDLLGIGIDGGTAVIIHRNELEVIGKSYVSIYDGTFQTDNQKLSIEKLPPNSERFYVLYGGAKYDLLKRKVIQFFRQ